MKYLVFSDVHGNLDAINKMFEKVSNMYIDMYLFCGDIVGYFFQSKEVIDILQQKRGLCIKGNHDAQYIQSLSDLRLRKKFVKLYGSSYLNSLPQEQIEWIKKLPVKETVFDEYASILLVHGSIKNNLDGRLYPDTEITEEFVDTHYDYIIMGHTHYRLKRRYQNTILLNPGSIGQPRDKQGFSFLILDTAKAEVEFYNLSLDLDLLRNEIIEKEYKSKKNRDYLLKKLEDCNG